MGFRAEFKEKALGIILRIMSVVGMGFNILILGLVELIFLPIAIVVSYAIDSNFVFFGFRSVLKILDALDKKYKIWN